MRYSYLSILLKKDTWNPVIIRGALFLVYFWFGVLKVLGMSPATPLVETLHAQTISFIPFAQFMILFGLGEVVLGILFLIPKATRLALWLVALHLFTAMLPLVVLPHMVWAVWLVPTLEGQYIIKNVLIIALAVVLGTGFKPPTSQPQG